MLPSPRLIIMILAAAPMFLAAALFPGMARVGGVYCLVVLAYAAVDALVLPGRGRLDIRRIVPERISLSVPTRIVFAVHNRTRRRLTIRLADALPVHLDAEQARCTGVFDAGARGTLEYRLAASKRGRYALRDVYVRVLPAMGLFYRQFTLALPAEVCVYPNLVNLGKYELLIRRGLLFEQGLARLRRGQDGSQFESLRAYAQGDPLSRVEWKATAKRSALVVKNYEPERNQSVMVALDVGRATASEFEGVSRLDTFVNATMLLAYAVLRQGDWLSLVAFSDRIETYLPPMRHVKNVEKVAQAMHQLEPRLVESDYAAACRFLGLKNRKRSLICLMTDVIDRHANTDILAYMARFARTHLPLVVALTDPEVCAVAHEPLARTGDPYSKAVALDVLAAREAAMKDMRRSGVSVLDVPPKALSPALINRYLTIKSTRRL